MVTGTFDEVGINKQAFCFWIPFNAVFGTLAVMAANEK